jgi:PKD repeat protein
MNAFGCTDTVSTTIIVHPNPNSLQTVSPTFGCAELEVDFENISTGGIDFIWVFGDGTPNDTTTNSSIQHIFDNNTMISQSYTTSLIAITDMGCTDTSYQQIQVYPKVTADFTVDTVGCSPKNTVFLNQSIGANQYEWDFGDGSNTQVTLNAQHTYYNNSYLNDTIFTSTLYIVSTFNCRDTLQKDITIHPKPLSLFSVDDTSGCSPLSVNLTNESIGAVFFNWNYGDLSAGSNTGDTVHNHLYYNTGSVTANYLTELISESNFGCKDTSYRNL